MSVTGGGDRTSAVQPDRGRRRDTDRGAVYAAEQQATRLFDRSAAFPVIEIAGSHLTLPPETRFGDLAAVQRYADGVLASDWVRDRWPTAAARPVTVRPRRGVTKAHYEPAGAVIALPPARGRDAWALRELVVLHEIAHHLGAGDVTHGAAFRERMLALVAGVVGAEAALLLRVCLADQGLS